MRSSFPPWALPRDRKTENGGPFRDVTELLSWLHAGQWVYFGRKPYHPSWILCWQLGRVIWLTNKGHIQKCCRSETGEPFKSDRVSVTWATSQE